jgi:chromosome segregation ATPase
MKTKTAKLYDARRIEAAEQAAEEFGSFNAFVRAALDEFDDELRLEREVEELAEELESKRERLNELRDQQDEESQNRQAVEDNLTEGLDDDIAQFYSDEPSGDSQ